MELRSVGWLTNRPDNSANDKLKIPAYHPNPSLVAWKMKKLLGASLSHQRQFNAVRVTPTTTVLRLLVR